MRIFVRTFLQPATLAALTILLSYGVAGAQEWGDLKGTIVFKGDIPAASKVAITKDVEFCGKHKLVNKALVVNPENHGIQNVVVWMYLKRSDDPPAVHEDYKETENADVSMVNLNCEFLPRVAMLRTTQTLLIGNKDPIGHNTKVDCVANTAINPIVPANSSLNPQKFGEQERMPVQVSCNVHPWMKGWLVIRNAPYFAVTDKDGKFEIKNVPTGDWTFQFWHEESGYVDDVIEGGSAVKWKKGRKAVKITAGGTDLGKIEVPAKTFE